MISLANGVKFLPHAGGMLSMVAAGSPHCIGPVPLNRPRIKSMQTKAPTYTGPLVPGWLPQYCPSCW